MKNKLSSWITVIVFCGFLGAMCLLLFLLPKEDFSENEKRFLAKTPAFNLRSVTSGQFGEDVESYMADHVPGRDFFVGLNAYFEKYTGRQIAKDIYTAGDRLVEAPVKYNDSQIQKNHSAIQKFSEVIQMKPDLMIVPSAGWAVEDTIDGLADPYRDEEIISDLAETFADCTNVVDVLAPFSKADKPNLYFKTDHHWTSLGAYTAYAVYMDSLSRAYPDKNFFEIETVEGFKGSTYSRSALWRMPAEQLELWHGSDGLLVTNSDTETVHEGVFYRNRLTEADKYTVYLDGNHPLVRIENPNAAGKGKILVIRDSYSNCLGTFLAESYETVVLVDLRYYKDPVSDLCKQEDFDNVLICYSIGNFMTDTNLVWLR